MSYRRSFLQSQSLHTRSKHILMQVYADLTLGAAENRDDGALTVSRHGLRTFICTWRIFRLLRSSSDNDKILAHLQTFTLVFGQ